MGLYINPPDGDKMGFIYRNMVNQYGMTIDKKIIQGRFPEKQDVQAEWDKGNVIVCVVDNSAFLAAGIMYNENELEAFRHTPDIRSKFWASIPLDCLTDESANITKELVIKARNS